MKYLHELDIDELRSYLAQCPKPGKAHTRRNINRRQQIEIVEAYIEAAEKALEDAPGVII